MLILLSNDVELNPGPTKEGELSVFHLNTRSMRHKLDYIESICNEADIICITETHLDLNITNDDIFWRDTAKIRLGKIDIIQGWGV